MVFKLQAVKTQYFINTPNLYWNSPSNVQDEVTVGIIVVVGASRYGDEVVSQPNVLCISLGGREGGIIRADEEYFVTSLFHTTPSL